MTTSDILQLIVMVGTVFSVVASAIWGVATMQAMTKQLKESVSSLTHSVDKLADRIDNIEREHAQVRERIARLEG
jgi:prefoldin subunit 5